MISVANLTKRFGRATAVDNLSFEVKRGELVGFLGPNGAGKTTTMRILSTFLPATGGVVTVCGFDVFKESLEVRRHIGYLPETVPLYTDMRVSEYLVFRGRLKGLRGRRLHARLDEVVETCGLTDVRRAVTGRLSKGYVQRVGLADSLIHDPDVLILDEPTIGLDPNQIRHIRGLIKSLGGRHTVLLSSHILSEVQVICERVLIINAGRIVAADRTEDLVGLMKATPRVWMEVQGPVEAILRALRSVPGVRGAAGRPAGDWNEIACDCESGRDLRADLSRAIAAGGWVVREIRSEVRNLEDAFAELTAESDTASGPRGGDGSAA